MISSAIAATTLMWSPAASSAHSGAAVAMANYAFSPATLTVTAGTTVTWTNSDQAPHDVTTTSAPVAIHSATLSKGQSWSYTFATPGTYSYICSYHPDMRASVIVTPQQTTPSAAVTTTRPARQARTTPARVSAAPVTVATRPAHRRSRSAVAAPAPSPRTTASTPTTAAAAAPPPAQPSLRPLLLVTGLAVAVATFCLLLLASRPERAAGTG